MKKPLLEAASLIALPLFVVVVAEVDDILARNVSRATGRGEHLALHARLDLARNLYEKLFPHATRFSVLVRFFQDIVGTLTVDPTSD